MITINGLTKDQVALLDIMWSIDDPEVYDEWKSALDLDIQNMVETLEQMVILACIDSETEQLQQFEEAKTALSKFAL